MNIYTDHIARALNLTPIEWCFNMNDYVHENVNIEPWNKGKVGLQSNKYKGTTGRYATEQLENISIKTKEAMVSMDKSCYKTRDSCNDRRWINKDGKHKRILRNEIDSYLELGWNEGRLLLRNEKGQIIGN